MNEFMKNFSLEGKIAFVTGASYGIGFAIANALSAAGATIVFNDINQDLVNKGLAAYEEKGIKAHGYVCDVTDEEAVQKTVAQIREEVGVIDILVNNAGITEQRTASRISIHSAFFLPFLFFSSFTSLSLLPESPSFALFIR